MKMRKSDLPKTMQKVSNKGADSVFLNLLFVFFPQRTYFLSKDNNLPDRAV